MLEPLKGFRTFKTDHCVTGSMRHVYDFHGYPLSEDLLLGLGAGVGFLYWYMKGMPPFLGGRANVGRPGEEGLEKTAGRRTGVRVECFQTASAAKAAKALLDALSRTPVMIRVDMGFLPYLGLPKGYHFGGHVVAVAGYDPGGREVLVADRDVPLHPVALDDLARARGSKFKPFPPRNAWFAFDFSGKRPPTPRETRQAIREVVAGMLRPPIANLGVMGIRKAGACVGKWADSLSGDDLRHACFNAFVFIDSTGGTGGGCFRYMYGRFLKEAAGITGERRLEAVGDHLRGIGDLWQQAAGVFRESSASRAAGGLSEAARLLATIAGEEEAAWTRLRTLV